MEDYGGLNSGAAHVFERETATAVEPRPCLWQSEGPDEATERDIPAFIAEQLNAEEKQDYILALNIRKNSNNRGRPPPRFGARPATPPRDARDIKCANCGIGGHMARDCRKPKLPMEERKCHICNTPGHIAAKCTEKMCIGSVCGATAATGEGDYG